MRDNKILMQHRAPWVHNGDTWGIPGGARDSHESAVEAAIREAHEEIGILFQDSFEYRNHTRIFRYIFIGKTQV